MPSFLQGGLHKAFGIVGILVTIFGVLNALAIPEPGCVATAEHVCQMIPVISLLGPKFGAAVAVFGAILTSLAKALTDSDKDGIPDLFESGTDAAHDAKPGA